MKKNAYVCVCVSVFQSFSDELCWHLSDPLCTVLFGVCSRGRSFAAHLLLCCPRCLGGRKCRFENAKQFQNSYLRPGEKLNFRCWEASRVKLNQSPKPSPGLSLNKDESRSGSVHRNKLQSIRVLES